MRRSGHAKSWFTSGAANDRWRQALCRPLPQGLVAGSYGKGGIGAQIVWLRAQMEKSKEA